MRNKNKYLYNPITAVLVFFSRVRIVRVLFRTFSFVSCAFRREKRRRRVEIRATVIIKSYRVCVAHSGASVRRRRLVVIRSRAVRASKLAKIKTVQHAIHEVRVKLTRRADGECGLMIPHVVFLIRKTSDFTVLCRRRHRRRVRNEPVRPQQQWQRLQRRADRLKTKQTRSSY